MRFSYVTYAGNGVAVTFVVPFPYISRSHVTVLVNGASQVFTWDNATTVRLASAPANGASVRVVRTTPKDALLVDFQDASVLTESLLDLNAIQNLYIAQEAFDASADAVAFAQGLTVAVGNTPPPTVGDTGRVLRATGAGAVAWSDDMATDIEVAAAAALRVAKAGDNMTGPLRLPFGAVGLPALTFDTDPDTGLFRPAADQVAVATGGAQRLLVENAQATLSTPLILPAASPTNANHATRKQYVDDLSRWEQLATVSFSNTPDFTFSGLNISTHQQFKLILNGRASAVNSNPLYIRVFRSGAIVSGATDYNNVSHVVQGSTPFINNIPEGALFFLGAGVNLEPFMVEMDINQITSTDRVLVTARARWTSSTPAHSFGHYTTNVSAGTGALTGIIVGVNFNAYTYAAGRATLLGLKV